MSKPRTTRSRKRQNTPEDEAGSPEAVETAQVAPPKPKPKPTPQPEPAPEPAKPAHKKIDLDDLAAIASMDEAELAALMDGSLPAGEVEVGQKITGTVSRVGATDVFVEIGGKSEATIDRAELPHAQVGQEIEAMVLHNDDQGVKLSLKLSGQAALEHLEDAMESGTPVEGVVRSRNRGGYEVAIGSVSAFCPMSMISRIPGLDPDSYIGQVLPFRVIETGDKVVLNRRVLQEEEMAEKAAELWATLEVGDARRGTVRNVQPFGVFVDIGGIDGLVPKREWLGSDPTPGQGVEIHVIDIDRANQRLTLSARDPANDPWNAVGVEIRRGDVLDGKVTRVAPFGVFVELREGVEGLVHTSRLPSGPPKPGSTLTVKINDIDLDRQRLELAPVSGDGVQPAKGEPVKGTVTEVLRNGLVVQLDDGRSAWLPAREVELEPGTVLAQRFRKGKPLEARVIEEGDRRVVLSLKDDPAESESAWRSHVVRKKETSGGFGTFGDLLGGLNLKK